MAKHRRKNHNPYAPQYWPTWLAVGAAWVITRLPLSWIRGLGTLVGHVFRTIGSSRRKITEQNIAACFPELSEAEQTAMVKSVFKQVSTGGLELMIPWLNPRRDLSRYFEVHGAQYLQAAVDQGRGVILIGAHYATMDVISAPLAAQGPIDVMYRYNKNPVWEWLQVSGRQRFFEGVIEREDTREVLKSLKRGRVIWYAPDQDYGAKHSVYAPFFGIDAATITATSRFAKLKGSPVLILRQTRNTDRLGWQLTFSPVIENFPSGDDVEDARRMNALLEEQIRVHPDQYLWLHKRFKTRPPGEPPFYQ